MSPVFLAPHLSLALAFPPFSNGQLVGTEAIIEPLEGWEQNVSDRFSMGSQPPRKGPFWTGRFFQNAHPPPPLGKPRQFSFNETLTPLHTLHKLHEGIQWNRGAHRSSATWVMSVRELWDRFSTAGRASPKALLQPASHQVPCGALNNQFFSPKKCFPKN